jgi:hypothetical protein
MKKYEGKSEDILDKIVDLQSIETENMDQTSKAIPNAKNPLIKTMLQALKLEAEKSRVLQQMIVDSMKKEAVHLSPDELQNLSGHLNRHIKVEEKALTIAKEAFEKSELAIPRYLLSYLIGDLKKQNALLRHFDDELKIASIPTSATSKTFNSSRAA